VRTNRLAKFVFISLSVGGFGLIADATPFQQILTQKMTGFSVSENQLSQSEALEEARNYAHYRQYPKSRRGEDFLLACKSPMQQSRFCEVITAPRTVENTDPISLPTRRLFQAALLSLDNVVTRSKRCPQAVKQLNTVIRDAKAARIRVRALYWQWVCNEGNAKNREALKRKIAQEYPLSLQNLMISETDGDRRLQELANSSGDWLVAFRSVRNPAFNSVIQGLEALVSLKEHGAAAVVERHYGAEIGQLEPEVQLYLAGLMNQVSESVPSVLPITRILQRLVLQQPQYLSGLTLKLLYPNDYSLYLIREARTIRFADLIEEVRGDIEWSLLAGLIHHESAINPRAASSAKAYGLAQMLVPTAKDVYDNWVDRSAFPVSREMLFDPKINLQLAVMDFKRRFGRFNGRLGLALASYNAGETAVEEWVKRSPKIQDERLQNDLLFMNEARDSRISDYVASVLAKRAWYKALYAQQNSAGEAQP
jgi:hypothetical protein